MYQRDFPGRARLGRDAFESLIDRTGLKVRNKKRKPRTTDSTHGLSTYPNLVKDVIPERPNQVWVCDITYLEIWVSECEYDFAYLSLVTDAYSKEVIGWAVGPTLSGIYSIQALEMAMKKAKERCANLSGLIHHSDRGVQYASSRYVELLRANGISISMTETGDPKENACAERVNNTVKNELLKDIRLTSIDDARALLAPRVDFYNNRRPHMSLDMMTPSMASNCQGEIFKHWHSYREAAIREKEANLSSLIPEKCLPLQARGGSSQPPVNLSQA